MFSLSEAKEKVRRSQLIQNTVASHGTFLTPSTILNTNDSSCKCDQEYVDEHSSLQSGDTSLSKCNQGSMSKEPETSVTNGTCELQVTNTHVVIETQQKEDLIQEKTREENEDEVG